MPEATQARQVHLWGQEGAFYGQEASPLRKNGVCRGEPCVHPCNGKTSNHCLVHWFTTLRLLHQIRFCEQDRSWLELAP
jgi:hypothetical protein